MARSRLLANVILTSEKLNAINEGSENLFYHILVLVDDFGRYYAKPEIIRSYCYPLRSVSLSSIRKRLDDIESVGLIQRYKNNGETYLEIVEFEKFQKFRSDIRRKEDFPVPTGYCNDSDTPRNESDTKRNVQSCPVSNNNNRDNNENENKIAEIISKWNTFANDSGLSPVLKLNDFRRTKILVRIEEKEFMFDAVLKAILLSPYLLGESDGGWRCNLDWLIKNNTNYIKTLEGQYYAKKKQTTQEKIDAWANKEE